MALDKLVDSTQLDADLTSVADAIRAKSGGSGQLAFPAGFVNEIESIETGGGGNSIDLLDPAQPAGALISTFSGTPTQYAVKGRTDITSIHLVNLVAVSGYCIHGNPALKTVVGEKSKAISNYGLAANTQLTTVDVLGGTGAYDRFYANAFNGNTALSAVIIRNPGVQTLSDVNAFRSTPFASGGTGGTIYIPKAMYDHLGDGSSLDYKAATNWSTYASYIEAIPE